MVWDLSQNTPLMTRVNAKLPGVPTYAISRQLVSNRPGSYAVIINPAAGFTIVDVQTGGVLTGTESSSFLAWRSDTELYYADSADRMVRLYDVAGRKVESSWPLDWPNRSGSDSLDIWSAPYVPSTNQLLLAGTRQIATLDAATGSILNQRTDLSYPTFSADGSRVFGIPDVLTPRGAVDRVTGGELRQLPTGPLELDPRVVQQNGSQLSGYDGDVLITQEKGALQRKFWTAGRADRDR